jgi:hypothetical protein
VRQWSWRIQKDGVADQEIPDALLVMVTARPDLVVKLMVLPLHAIWVGSAKMAVRSPASAM